MITLIPHQTNWSSLFTEEKNLLSAKLGNIAVQIEHIGSTAIPGICAKPVIDILLGVNNLEKFTPNHIKLVEALGYQYIPDYEQQLPYRRYFQKNDMQGNRAYQIHLVNYHSAWWQRHLLFRDYLRAYPEKAKEYEAHKILLAKDFNDTNLYAIAKTDFCRKIDKAAYFDFKVHKPVVTTQRLNGYLPQLSCVEIYCAMFHDPDFIRCFGIKMNVEGLTKIITKDVGYWDRYGYGPFVWFDKETGHFVGEGGLNHTKVAGHEEIELTYSFEKNYWGHGLAVEIGRFALDYGFNTLALDSIVCFTRTKNYQSLRVMEKLEFQYERDFMHCELPHKLFRLKNPQAKL